MRFATILGLAGLLATTAQASPPSDGAASARTPEVVVLHVAAATGGGEVALRERRFTTELQLALDGLAVHATTAPDGFVERPLSDQIALVRTLVSGRHAVAVVWIGHLDPDILLLHVVALSTHRALVRLLEAKLASDVEARLALAARELLGTAYLLTPEDADAPPGLRAAVQGVRQQVVEVPAADSHMTRSWGIAVRARVEGALSDARGPSALQGGELGVERHLVGPLWARAGLGGAVGPSGDLVEGRVKGHELWPAAGVSLLWNAPAARLGVGLEAQARFARLRVRVGEGAEQTLSQERLRLQGSGELQWLPTRELGLSFQLGLGLSSHRERYARSSTGEPFLERPSLDWSFQVGPRLAL